MIWGGYLVSTSTDTCSGCYLMNMVILCNSASFIANSLKGDTVLVTAKRYCLWEGCLRCVVGFTVCIAILWYSAPFMAVFTQRDWAPATSCTCYSAMPCSAITSIAIGFGGHKLNREGWKYVPLCKGYFCITDIQYTYYWFLSIFVYLFYLFKPYLFLVYISLLKFLLYFLTIY